MRDERSNQNTRRLRRMRVGVLGGAAIVLAGCASGPDVESQRQTMLAVTKGTIADLADRGNLTEVAILDDGTTPVSCPGGGEQYRYIAYGEWNSAAVVEDVDQRLDDVMGTVLARLDTTALEGHFDTSHSVELDPDGPGPRQDNLIHPDVTLTVDYLARDNTSVMLRFAGETAC